MTCLVYLKKKLFARDHEPHFTELLLQPYEIDMFTKIKCTMDITVKLCFRFHTNVNKT